MSTEQDNELNDVETIHTPPLQESTLDALEEAFDEAEEKIAQSGDFAPFTVSVIDDGYMIEEHPGNTPEECFEFAEKHVTKQMPKAYVFCYDGYVTSKDKDGEEQTDDAIICEAADADEAHVYAIFYSKSEEEFKFDDGVHYLGTKESFLR